MGTGPTVCDFGVLLRDVLGFTDEEFVSLGYQNGAGGFRTAVYAPADAVAVVLMIPRTADVFFGINPVTGPARKHAGRGTEADVTRLAALPIDLDIKPKACASMDIAKAIVAEVGLAIVKSVTITKPAATVNSGHGLHAYWPVADGAIDATFTTDQAQMLLRRFGRLVTTIADRHEAKLDNVFDLTRMLRVPGSTNNKESK